MNRYHKLLLVLLITRTYEYMKEVFVVRHQVQIIEALRGRYDVRSASKQTSLFRRQV